MPSPALTVGHYENFPVAGILCPAAIRDAVTAIYAWSRAADDIADEGAMPCEQRLALLAALRAQLPPLGDNAQTPEAHLAKKRLLHPSASKGISSDNRPTPALAPLDEPFVTIAQRLNAAIARHAIPAQPFHDLLTAFEHDVCASATAHIPANHAALLAYCRHSAAPVGRLVLHLWGVHDARAQRQSDAICAALQLINFWQDTSVDLARGRCYLPSMDCAKFGLDARQIASNPHLFSPQDVWPLIDDLLGRAERLMHSGSDLPARIGGRNGWQLRLIIQGGLRMAAKVRRQKGASVHRRDKLHALDWLCVLFKALYMPKIRKTR